jgi:two-component system, OmpR family, sensor histidine kinase ChvG
MRLAGQLLAVSAVTLLLPWAGCQYAREIESALRDGEE